MLAPELLLGRDPPTSTKTIGRDSLSACPLSTHQASNATKVNLNHPRMNNEMEQYMN